MIADRTQAELQLLLATLAQASKGTKIYESDSRNPALAAGVDTLLANLKTQLDATIADTTP